MEEEFKENDDGKEDQHNFFMGYLKNISCWKRLIKRLLRIRRNLKKWRRWSFRKSMQKEILIIKDKNISRIYGKYGKQKN